METEKEVECTACGKQVPERIVDRWGECMGCRANDKATDMGVGDINTK